MVNAKTNAMRTTIQNNRLAAVLRFLKIEEQHLFTMKLRRMAALALLAACATQYAGASVINILGSGDFAWHDSTDPNTGKKYNNSPDANLDWLKVVVANQPNGGPLTPPTTTLVQELKGIGDDDDDNSFNGSPLVITGIVTGDYLVLHYGKGSGGAAPGGGWVGLFFDADQASYTVPNNGSGPNGNGGISYARLYDHAPGVPDGGCTAMLLGVSLTGLAAARRFIKK